MKTTPALLSVVGLSLLVMTGFALNSKALPTSEVDQVHLSCWSDQLDAPVERIRLVLNRDRSGLAWLANFSGTPTGEAQILPSEQGGSKSTFSINVKGLTQDLTALIPLSVFQAQVHSLQMKINQGEISTALECRKLNLRKHESARL